MKRFLRLITLVLCAAMLTGCGVLSAALKGFELVHYEDMEYTRPDMDAMERALETAISASKTEPLTAVMDGVYGFYEEYDWFYTNYALADVRMCHDMTDIYWEEEYAWCMENTARADAMLEELYYALADSPIREELEGDAYFGEGFFDSYQGESIYDEVFLNLLEREADLTGQYYDLSEQALAYEYGSEAYYSACADAMAALLVELIGLRQEIARYCGYEDYVSFANDFYYYRDYTAAQTEGYLRDIAEYMVPMYRNLDREEMLKLADVYSGEMETFAYVKQAAKEMGGLTAEAFSVMESGGLYDIGYGENKYAASFEIYLPGYYLPFVFVNPGLTRYDCLTLSHEFGHFCNDYASYGSYAGVDVMEVFSQGMEYLMLCYGEDTENLTRVKMADSLCLFVEQAAFASFEGRMYELTGEELTVEKLYALYDETAKKFGLDAVGYDKREFVSITHIYTNPMYIQSYIFSNDAAMQLYGMEQENPGAGLKLYEENLASQEMWFLAFVDQMGLASPFAEGRVEALAATFRDVLE